MVLWFELQPEHGQRLADPVCITGPYDRRGHRRLFQHPARGHSCNRHPVPLADVLERAQQRLKRDPAAELVDHQLVLDQRAIGDAAERFILSEPALRKKPPG